MCNGVFEVDPMNAANVAVLLDGFSSLQAMMTPWNAGGRHG